MEKYFAAFIMTYQRSAILESTIDQICKQDFPPEKILVVDNSQDFETERLIRWLANPRVQYHRVGYNAGPAGAARIGLKQLVQEGFQWIYWGDDDNPPPEADVFKILLQNANDLAEAGVNIGAIGASGSRFNVYSGKLQRLKNSELVSNVEVDMIAANTFIINAQPVREGILPHEELFFGFEELDFCMQMKSKGFKLFCHGPMLLRHRTMFNRAEKMVFKLQKEDSPKLKRRYYSYRNLFYIMIYRKRLYWTAFVLLIRWIIKSMLNIRFGFVYFFSSLRILAAAVKDAGLKRMGFNSTALP